MNFVRLASICDQISDLEDQIKHLTQLELQPALEETLLLIREHVPTLKSIIWQQNSRDSWLPELGFMFEQTLTAHIKLKDLGAIINHEQKEILRQLEKLITDNVNVYEMAFGKDVELELDTEAGRLFVHYL